MSGRTPPGRLAAAACVLALAGLAPPAGLADRLHLTGGGTIDTHAWWVEGDTLHYESPAGTIGIPRTLVERIERGTTAPAAERTATAPGQPAPGAGRTAPAPEQPAPGAGRTAVTPAADDARPADGAAAILVDRRTHDELVEARQAMESRDFETASRVYWSVLHRHPGLETARVGYALAEMGLGRDGMALGTVLDGLARDRRQPALLELLGDLRNREERVEDAVRAWREAFELDPGDRLRDKIFKAERELAAGRGHAVNATSHFTMRYDGRVDEALADEVADWLEEQFWVLADAYDHTPPQPITVLLYTSRQFRDVTQTPEWVGGLYDGKIRVPLGGLERLNPPTRRLLVHELAHAVIHSKSRGSCPRWLHEGLAQLAEGRHLTEAERLEVRRRLAGLRAPERWAADGVSYPMALSLARWLEAERGLDGLVRVVDALGRGADVERALTEVYGRDHATLCRRWAESVAAREDDR